MATPPRTFSDRTVRNLCIFPVLILLIAFNVFPLLASLFFSVTQYNPAFPEPPKFVGLQNYSQMIDDAPPGGEGKPYTWIAFQRTAAMVAITVTLQTVIGFGAALLLHRKFPGRGVLTALLLIPMMLSPAVMAAFWRYMFDTDAGVINWLLESIGGRRYAWKNNAPLAFWAVVIVEVWMWTPFMMLLSLAGLNSIPPALYEAAEVDRASAWFRFRNITLPLVTPLLLLGIVFRCMDTFRLFDTPNVLSDGPKPDYPSTLVSVLLYHRSPFNQSSLPLGHSTALAYLVLIVAVAFGNLAVRYLDRIRDRGEGTR
jgi:multiple sugar transport system permease protein